MRYEEIKEKIQKIQGAVSDFGVLIGPQTSTKRVNGVSVVPGLGMESDAKSYEMMADDIKKGIFKVLFMGEFKQGKSTTINAVIGKNAVPTKVVACTAIITILLYGTDTSKATVYKNNQTPEVLSLDNFFEKYQLTLQDEEMIEAKGYIDRFADVEYAIIESDHKIFQNGVRIIDSPGLGEADSRTKTTLNFVSSANAVIFLLNATKLFSKDEKEYIKANFANKQLKNVFFLINKINLINGSIEDIIPTVEFNLKTVFTDKHGNFDRDLFEKRVFYVNAYKAYKAKQDGTLNELPLTGMPKFESALEEFLASEDRIFATFQSTLTGMANTYRTVISEVENRKKALSLPLSKLEANHKESLAELNKLESKVLAIEKTFSATSAIVQSKVYSDLVNYVSVELPKMWDEDVTKNEAKFGITEVLKLATTGVFTWNKQKRDEKQAEIIKPLSDSIQKYLTEKLDGWGRRADVLISPEVDAMNADLEEYVQNINLGLNKASDLFTQSMNTHPVDGKGPNPLQLGLSLIQGDANVLIENAAGGNFSWGEWIKRYAIQAVMQIFIFSLFTGGWGFIAWIVMESIQLAIGTGSLKEKFLVSMSSQLFAGLREEVQKNAQNLKAGIEKKFIAESNAVTEKSRQLIAERKAEQQRILDQKRNEQFNIDAEVKRIETITAKLFSLMSAVYYQLFSRQLTPEEVDYIARSTSK